MARDASLDDFAAGTDDVDDEESVEAANDGGASDEAGGEEAASDVAGGEETATDEADAVAVEDPSAVEPAVATSTLSTDGTACASCGASTRRLWTAEGEAVCADCKPW